MTKDKLALGLRPAFKPYTLRNIRSIEQLVTRVSEEELFNMEVVSHVLPFKTNNYVVEELIDWDNIPNDPLFILNFPQKDMLLPHHFEKMAAALKSNADKETLRTIADEIRMDLNPHPAGQLTLNLPILNGHPIMGMQHKYRETALFFPSQGQTCHAYCTFCFRWPQFTGMHDMKFASKEADEMVSYLKEHPEITNLLFTGGDPLVMKAQVLEHYIDAILEADLYKLHTIRIGSKALAYWPYRFLTDDDSELLLNIFKKVQMHGKQLTLMAHFNHPRELETKAVKKAIKALRDANIEIRTQSPILRHINDDYKVWSKMWRKQAKLGCVPYYMFVARDTGANHYFNLPLEKCWNIYRRAYAEVSGVSRTVRGPSMSAAPGKVHVVGITEIAGEKVFVLQFLQGRNPDWVRRPFFAKYDPDATWLTDLEPPEGEEFFWQDEFDEMCKDITSKISLDEQE